MLQISDKYEVPIPTNWDTRLAHNFVGWIERIIARDSRVGLRPVFSKELFPWVPKLEAATAAIRAELVEILRERDALPGFHEIMKEVSSITSDRRWQTFMFYGYGVRIEANLQRCPATAAALQDVPGLQTAFFSILAPGKRIPEHRGPYNGVLRLHLGLIIPEPAENCWIRVHDQRLQWREGEALIIDDSFRHEVHNDTDGDRVVLFLDFERPCRGWGQFVNRMALRLSRITPPIRMANRKLRKWHRTAG